jgi:hypothetical protein
VLGSTLSPHTFLIPYNAKINRESDRGTGGEEHEVRAVDATDGCGRDGKP